MKFVQKIVSKVLMTQAGTKVSGLDNIYFQILQMIWDWVKVGMKNIVRHSKFYTIKRISLQKNEKSLKNTSWKER